MNDSSQVETQISVLEIPKDIILAKLSEPDRANVVNLQKYFENYSQSNGYKGAMLIVGGILTKPFPRKDMDIRVIFESKKWEHQDAFTYANEKFENLLHFTDEILNRDPSFTIAGKIGPSIDEEFNNSSILSHDGSIMLKKDGCTPIELLNAVQDSVEKLISIQKSSFCVLSKV